MRLIEVRAVRDGDGILPFKKGTIYKKSCLGEMPDVIFRVEGKLFFDLDRWQETIELARADSVARSKKRRRLPSVNNDQLGG